MLQDQCGQYIKLAAVTFVLLGTETVFVEERGCSLVMDQAIAAWPSHLLTVSSVRKTIMVMVSVVMVMVSVNTEQS